MYFLCCIPLVLSVLRAHTEALCVMELSEAPSDIANLYNLLVIILLILKGNGAEHTLGA